jgi:hypothetical protein
VEARRAGMTPRTVAAGSSESISKERTSAAEAAVVAAFTARLTACPKQDQQPDLHRRAAFRHCVNQV